MIGKKISPYRIVDFVREGGRGAVYKVEEERLGRTVALEFLSRDLTSDEPSRATRLNEARTTDTLRPGSRA